MAIQFIGLPAVQIDPRAQRVDFSPLNQGLTQYRQGAAEAARVEHLQKAAALNDPRAQADYLFRAGLPQEAMAIGIYPEKRNALMAQTARTQAQTGLLQTQAAAARQVAELRRNLLMGDVTGAPAATPAVAPPVAAPAAPPTPTPMSALDDALGGFLPPMRRSEVSVPTLGPDGGSRGATAPAARPAAPQYAIQAIPGAAPTAAAPMPMQTVMAPNGQHMTIDQARLFAMRMDAAGIRNEPFEKAIADATTTARGGGIPEAVRTQAIKSDVAYRNLASALDSYERLVQRTGAVIGPGQERDAVAQARTNILLQLKELFNLGVLNGPDLDLMEKMIPDPSIGIGPSSLPNVIPGNAAQRVSGGVQRLRDMLRTVRNNAVAPVGGAPVGGEFRIERVR